MSILPQHHRLHRTTTICHRHRHHNHRVYCATTTPIKTRPKLESLVINTTPPKIEDPSLKSTWSHRAWVATGCTTVLASLASSFHAWAHGTKSKLPPVVVALQDAGVLVSRSQHAAHHRPPYNNNYCIVSGVWNRFLDDHKVFEALEMVLFFKLGLRPRSWSEPNSDWTEEAEDSPVTFFHDTC
ncbi:hypothetical protein L1987_07435 [Smallanthus sonchifolius]|uniref:Uncharacterized protein n=1 Tax=Smallanthus sonchifolius TaxID=185202 RepID=A0ACB9K0J2_9ASTR|nr:hypothetical protein L1987_07435 [Smallanthus sonchifolius]